MLLALIATSCASGEESPLRSAQSFSLKDDNSGQVIDIDLDYRREAIRGSHAGFNISDCHNEEFFCLSSSFVIAIPRDCSLLDQTEWSIGDAITAVRVPATDYGLSTEFSAYESRNERATSDFTSTLIFHDDGSFYGLFISDTPPSGKHGPFYRYVGGHRLGCKTR
tara:strand:- start:79 stop:576 length:498 start_codon:yes stop_codon:yes gene_type:complete